MKLNHNPYYHTKIHKLTYNQPLNLQAIENLEKFNRPNFLGLNKNQLKIGKKNTIIFKNN